MAQGYPAALMAPPRLEVRDPIHGAVPIAPIEQRVLDHALFQRLRHIRQLGFSDLSFPGATHTRYLHSIGAMHLAGQAFDNLFDGGPVPEPRRSQLRAAVRCSALLHDVGHAPFSHASEFAMPMRSTLKLPDGITRGPDRQATHEDYTLAIVTNSTLTPVIEAATELPARAVAALIDPAVPHDPAWFQVDGVDFRPLLQQLISSELDVDRMDYLRRDSHFAGVHYGVFDTGWIMGNLRWHVVDDRAHLALHRRAIWAFEDFLIARHHMFLMVYFHYRSVAYEEMLRRYFEEGGDGYAIPSDVEAYATTDDLELFAHLRRSKNHWARRIIERDEWKLFAERQGDGGDLPIQRAADRLREAGIEPMVTASKSVLSKYFQKRKGSTPGQEGLPWAPTRGGPPPIYVIEEPYRGSDQLRAVEIEHATELFTRYEGPLRLSRLYVPRERVADAGRVAGECL